MKSIKILLLTTAVFFLLQISSKDTYAHCDGIDGPVVTSAKKALETENVNYVLIWVQKEDENIIKDAFEKTLHVRALNQAAKELADNYFFETLVRIHRAGEGENYTGLKPAGRNLGPAIPAADKAIHENSFTAIKEIFNGKNDDLTSLEKIFKIVLSKKNYDIDNVEAGRSFVHSYVEFLHKTEHMYSTKELHETRHEHSQSNTHDE